MYNIAKTTVYFKEAHTLHLHNDMKLFHGTFMPFVPSTLHVYWVSKDLTDELLFVVHVYPR